MASTVYVPASRPETPAAPRSDRSLNVAIGALVVLVAGSYAIGAISMLRVGYPALCFVVGLWLYLRSRPRYVAFTLWVWFLSAFLRRLADYKGGYQETSLILLAPYLVTAISGIDLLTKFRDLARARSIPFVMAFGAILYGIFVGLTRFTLRQMGPPILNWVVPVCFGFFLVESYHEHEAIRRSLKTTFMLGATVTGIYSAIQFFFLPAWDQLWLSNVQTTTFGEAEPMKVRAFSTMNAPVIFALIVMCEFLVILCLKSKFRYVAVIAGFVGLLFSFNRSAWIGLVAGICYLMVKLAMRERGRVVSALLVGLLVAPLVLLVPGVEQLVVERMITMADPNGDVSFQARLEGYRHALTTLAGEPYGEGVASPDVVHFTMENDDVIGPHDSLVLELLYSLGWCGTIFYLAGLGILVGRTFPHKGNHDRFGTSMKAVVVALFAQCLLNDIVYGEIGLFLWCACGMLLSGVARDEEKEEALAASASAGVPQPAFQETGLLR